MLKSFYSAYNLTTDQKKAIDLLNNFVFNDVSCFILKGSAGTGKTFLIKGLVKYLISKNRAFMLAAPTGRAAKIIRDKTNVKAQTIHKIIYSNTKIKEYPENEDVSETFKFYFKLNNNKTPTDTIFIIDEASMISNKYSDNEFFRFGSGKLLQDLIEFVGIGLKSVKRKIIFIGDNSQLPPVNTNFSPALDKKYLTSHFGFSVDEFELSSVVRQNQTGGILYNATKIKDDIKKNIFNIIFFEKNFSDIHSIDYNSFFQTYLKICGDRIDENTIIIAATNSSVGEYNKLVRDYFFKGRRDICINDRVIIVKNNYINKIVLLNGDFAVVKEVGKNTETKFVNLKKKLSENKIDKKKIRLDFRDVVITVFDSEQDKFIDVKCKIIENTLYSEKADLSSDEIKALYVLFKQLNPNLKPKSALFTEALKNDPYFNALRIKFGYAITCHKAQGGEWDNVFVDLKSSNGYLNSFYFRWCYTAITRAKKNLFMINEPKFNIDDSLKIKNNKINQNVYVIEPKDMKADFKNLSNVSLAQKIFLAVKSLMDFADIKNVSHYQYSEHYEFFNSLEEAKIIIYYNKDEIITKILSATDNYLSEKIMDRLSVLIKKKIIYKNSKEGNNIQSENIIINFPKDKPYLRELYLALKRKSEDFGYFIKGIKHLQYHEIYEFEKNGEIIFIDIYYNKKGQFTRLMLNKKSKASLKEIRNLLKLLDN